MNCTLIYENHMTTEEIEKVLKGIIKEEMSAGSSLVTKASDMSHNPLPSPQMNGLPIGYPSLKVVLQYLSIEKRTGLRMFSPAIQNLHESVPIQISHLILHKHKVIVDNRVFSFRVIVNSDKDQVFPEGLRLRNMHGGAEFDVDDKGNKETNEELIENDVSIRLNPSNFNVFVASRLVQSATSRMVELYQLDWRPTTVKYTSNVVLTTVVKSGHIRRHRKTFDLPIGTKIRNVYRNYLRYLFVNKGTCNVQKLTISMRDGVLRIPDGFFLRIRELEVLDNSNDVINSVRHFVSEESFPLQNLTFKTGFSGDPVFQNELLRTACSLTINTSSLWDKLWIDVFKNLPNQKIRVRTDSVPEDLAIEMVQNLINNPRNTDFRFSFQCNNVQELIGILWRFSDRTTSNRCNMFPNRLIHNLGENCELHIYGDEAPGHEEEGYDIDGLPWIIVIQTVETTENKGQH